MKYPVCISIALLLFVFCGIEQASAQATKNAEGYSVFTYADLQSATLTDIEPEVGYDITSYTVTIACEKKHLNEMACTGDTLSTAFYTYLTQANTNNCLCYFDRIMAGDAPRKGFVIKVEK